MEIIISKECKVNIDDVPAFAQPDYLLFKGQNYGYIYGQINQEIVFFSAFILKKRYFFCLAEFQIPVICLNDSYKDQTVEFMEKGLQELNKKYNVDFVCQNPAYAIFNIYPKGAQYTYFGSYICNLENTEEQLWKKIHSKHRNVIRKAQNMGVEIKFNDYDIDEVYEIISNTQKRSGNGFISKEQFLTLAGSMSNGLDIISAYYNGELQGCAVMAHDKKRAYYLYGGSCAKTSPGALNLMHWQAMLYYKGAGLLEYDFVGARLSDHISEKIQGIQRFKSRFGGDLKKGFLWKYIFKSHKYWLYKLLCFIKKGKWEVDAIDEEHITDI